MMRTIRTNILLAILSLTLALSPLATAAENPNPNVLPPGSSAYGMTLGEWSAAWWQWAAGIPGDINPLRDETGEQCDLDQSGPVWFLAGTELGPPDAAVERECTIPAGKAILFPILNLVFFNCPGEAFTEEEMRAQLDFLFSLFPCNLECTIDGVPIEGLDSYRTQSPAFEMTLPTDGILGCDDLPAPAGDYFPSVSEGVWILHTPLSEGEHEISFRAALCVPGTTIEFAATDTTYLITVVDEDD